MPSIGFNQGTGDVAGRRRTHRTSREVKALETYSGGGNGANEKARASRPVFILKQNALSPYAMTKQGGTVGSGG
jgi:hypothetical protein